MHVDKLHVICEHLCVGKVHAHSFNSGEKSLKTKLKLIKKKKTKKKEKKKYTLKGEEIDLGYYNETHLNVPLQIPKD